ncbi:MAG: hypothetical protein LC808_32550 [Actinobacteria bacterium]|nr:hypothetical protein [Actinomycetota bacterium]
MAWVLIIPYVLLLLLLAALPVAFAAVAVRLSQATVRVAAVTLLAVPGMVVLIFAIGAMTQM